MPATVPDRLERIQMPLDDYLALPEGRVEWVDGEAIFMSAAPRAGHQRVAARLARLIEDSTGLFVVEAVGMWTVERRKSRIPDVLATREPFDDSWAPEVPVLVVEVLSSGTRGEDTVRKSHEYAEAGVSQYWVVDRDQRELTVYANAGDGWRQLFAVDDDRPTGAVAVGAYGEVVIDLPDLLRP